MVPNVKLSEVARSRLLLKLSPNVKLSEVARYVQGPSKLQQKGSIGPPNSCKATAAHSAASNAAVSVAVVVAAVVAAVDADDGGS